MPRYAEQAVVVEDQGGEHLASDEQRHERRRTDSGHEHDGNADIDGPEQPAAPCPPVAAGHGAGLGHLVTQNQGKDEHADRSTEIAHESCPCGGVQACPQICIDRLLHDEAESGDNGEQADSNEGGELRHAPAYRGFAAGVQRPGVKELLVSRTGQSVKFKLYILHQT
ncbi:hypothetical protein THIX_60322 [Thiomonas sp. X19]|nr:hypothetical protein THIX_60322 [Thiomonas sp. X19]